MDDKFPKVEEMLELLDQMKGTLVEISKKIPKLSQRIRQYEKMQAEKGAASTHGRAGAGAATAKGKAKSTGNAKPKKRAGKEKKNNEEGTK